MKRPAEIQSKIDEETRNLSLYQYHACPFCVKVRRSMKRLNLNIETRDPRQNPDYRDDLVKGGGELKVPCLRVVGDDGQVQWVYESSEIVSYLESRYAA